MWDDKFGLIEGVGKDAPTVENARGGRQSSTQYACHLLDPNFLRAMEERLLPGSYAGPLTHIANFMITGDREHLVSATLCKDLMEGKNPIISNLFTITKVLKQGAEKYEANNWRLIPQEDHLNHAVIHYLAYLAGDEQDDHYDHYLCRMMMSYATEPTLGFSYTEYIPKPTLDRIK